MARCSAQIKRSGVGEIVALFVPLKFNRTYMKQKVFAALVAFALAMLVHGYLTMHYYPIVYGYASGPSLCNVGAKLDCDAVTASAYFSRSVGATPSG